MATQKQSNQRIHELGQILASYVPKLPGTDANLLTALCKAVLSSVAFRDLKRTTTEELVAPAHQSVLATIKVRAQRRDQHGRALGTAACWC